MKMLLRLFPDRFVLMLILALATAWLVPVSAGTLSVAQTIIFCGIFGLFFLHGLRLPFSEVAVALQGFQLQTAMLGFTFLAFPLAGWIIASMAVTALPTGLVTGILFLAVLPSTVQSAISYASLSGGNVAASVVGAALSNLSGILLTPMLAALLIGAAGDTVMNGDVVIKIATMLLLPFCIGQLSRKWLGYWATQRKEMLSYFDRAVILLAVYIAFSGAVVSGELARLDGQILFTLALVLAVLLVFAFGGAMLFGLALGLNRADRVTLIFAGAHKSIATGAPMAAVLFGGDAGLIILPAIVYHMAQLIVSAPLAARLARA